MRQVFRLLASEKIRISDARASPRPDNEICKQFLIFLPDDSHEDPAWVALNTHGFASSEIEGLRIRT